MKKIISILLSVSLGGIFIFSAASKIYPMEPFEFQFVDLGIASWKTAPYIARLFIALEFFLGMLLLLNISLKKITLKLAVALLFFFCIYLVFRIITEGNTGNCGCFGELVKMSPLEGIIKNIVLILASIIAYFSVENELWAKKWEIRIIPILAIGALCLGFFIYPIDAAKSSSIDKASINYRVPLELMYDSTQTEKPTIDLMKGKHIVAFLSLTCSHCRVAAKKLYVIHKKNPMLPIYIALNGEKELLPEFFDDTNTKSIPHNLFLGPEKWMQVAGFALPNILYIDNSIVKKKCDGAEISQEDMEQWMQQ